MPESIDSVNAIIAFCEKYESTANNPEVRELLGLHREAMKVVRDDLIHLKGLTSALPPDLGNIYDLPAELLEELSVAKTDELEDQIATVINSYAGAASLDQILVGLFRKFGVKQKRRFLQNKLYRMPGIWSVEGRKGVYSTSEPTEEPEVKESSESSGGYGSYSSNAESYAPDLDDEIPF